MHLLENHLYVQLSSFFSLFPACRNWRVHRLLFKILQAGLKQYINWELPDVPAGFRKGRGTRDQIANIPWIIEQRISRKNIYFCFIEYVKAFDGVDHNNLWKILKEMVIPDHLICLLRNLYAGQEATGRTCHGTTDWFHIGKGVCKGCILSPCLFNFYAEYIMWNARLDKSQIGIKIAREITTSDMQLIRLLIAENKEEWENLLMRVRGEWKSWFKTQHLKNKDHGNQSRHGKQKGTKWKQ